MSEDESIRALREALEFSPDNVASVATWLGV